jgi:hypothetical protein
MLWNLTRTSELPSSSCRQLHAKLAEVLAATNSHLVRAGHDDSKSRRATDIENYPAVAAFCA